MKFFAFICLCFLIISCGDKIDPLDGFQRIGGQGATHFVHVSDSNLFGDKIKQRAAGKALCEKYNNEYYCEVYMWKNRKDVAMKLPVIRGKTLIGLYTQKSGKVRLKSLQ